MLEILPLVLKLFLYILSVSVQASETIPTLGEDYTLTCTVSGADVSTYEWNKDGSILLSENEERLQFQPLVLSDSGLYMCVIIHNSTSYDDSVGITLQC